MEKYEKPVMEVVDFEKDIMTTPGLPGHGGSGNGNADECPDDTASGGTP